MPGVKYNLIYLAKYILPSLVPANAPRGGSGLTRHLVLRAGKPYRRGNPRPASLDPAKGLSRIFRYGGRVFFVHPQTKARRELSIRVFPTVRLG